MFTWNICISEWEFDWRSSPTINTRILLYISMGSLDMNAVGSWIREAGNLSITCCNNQHFYITTLFSKTSQIIQRNRLFPWVLNAHLSLLIPFLFFFYQFSSTNGENNFVEFSVSQCLVLCFLKLIWCSEKLISRAEICQKILFATGCLKVCFMTQETVHIDFRSVQF